MGLTEGEGVLPTLYQQYIHLSKYSRWRDDLGRRETWPETTERYFNFWEGRFPGVLGEDGAWLRQTLLGVGAVSSMRCLMTAGPALETDEIAGYNCAHIAMNRPEAWDEAMYLLMCFHPDTRVMTRLGHRRIEDIQAGDEVMSFNEATGEMEWARVTKTMTTPTAHRPKLRITLENDEVFDCTVDHRWLTENRGWVRADELTLSDDLVSAKHKIYKVSTTQSDKVYIGYTSTGVSQRLQNHLAVSRMSNEAGAWKSTRPLSHAMRKYPETWRIEVIDLAYSKTEALRKEQEWIQHFGAFGKRGYNATPGGNHCGIPYIRTDEHRQVARDRIMRPDVQAKIVAARRTPAARAVSKERNSGSKNPMYGSEMAEDEKRRRSVRYSGTGNPFFGEHHSPRTRQEISKKKRGQHKGGDNPFFGRKHSDETRAKMRAVWARRREDLGADQVD